MEVLFRASGVGVLTQIPRGQGMTANQNKELDKLLEKEKTKPLTALQEEKKEDLLARRNNEPDLTSTAKKWIHEIWLENNKGYKHEFESKYTEKGLQAEEDAINLISEVDGKMYFKNKERITKGNLTGECDVIHERDDIKIVDDIKCSWSPLTFMSAGLEVNYEWQLRAYMYLYGAQEARLRYCLVDCPQDLYNDLYSRFCFQNGIIDDSLPKYQDAIQQFELNHVFSTNRRYTKEERVKTFVIHHDQEKIDFLLRRIEKAKEYYQSITLNQIL